MSKRFLVDTDWLHNALENDSVRVFDCTTILRPDPRQTYTVEAARDEYENGHIPGAGFLDLQGEFSDNASRLRFTFPSNEQFSAAAGANGISNEHHVVLYSTTVPMWATRMWWMFRTFGHDRVSVLDGGFAKWQREGRPVSTTPDRYPAAAYRADANIARVADKQAVMSAIENGGTCVLNALSREQFKGEGTHYGRPGRIRNSESLPWNELLDRETGCFLPMDALHEKLSQTSATRAERVITYCGGGIAASVDLFALALLGMEDKVALYDASLSEWARDDSAPMETG